MLYFFVQDCLAIVDDLYLYINFVLFFNFILFSIYILGLACAFLQKKKSCNFDMSCTESIHQFGDYKFANKLIFTIFKYVNILTTVYFSLTFHLNFKANFLVI